MNQAQSFLEMTLNEQRLLQWEKNQAERWKKLQEQKKAQNESFHKNSENIQKTPEKGFFAKKIDQIVKSIEISVENIDIRFQNEIILDRHSILRLKIEKILLNRVTEKFQEKMLFFEKNERFRVLDIFGVSISFISDTENVYKTFFDKLMQVENRKKKRS